MRAPFYHGYFPVCVSDAVAVLTDDIEKSAIATVAGAYGWVSSSHNVLNALRECHRKALFSSAMPREK